MSTHYALHEEAPHPPAGKSFHPVYCWRQTTPVMQLACLHMALFGDVSNLLDGFVSKQQRVKDRILNLENQILELARILAKGQGWEKDKLYDVIPPQY